MDVFESIIEIPMGTKNKYEINKKTGKIKLDRVLFSALSYPGEYGYINETLADDGDPLDILIISSYKTFPGCYVDARIIGYLDVIDNNEHDQKIIGVVNNDPRLNKINNISDISEAELNEISDFFLNYKKLQNVNVTSNGYFEKRDALNIIEKCKKNFKKNFKKN